MSTLIEKERRLDQLHDEREVLVRDKNILEERYKDKLKQINDQEAKLVADYESDKKTIEIEMRELDDDITTLQNEINHLKDAEREVTHVTAVREKRKKEPITVSLNAQANIAEIIYGTTLEEQVLDAIGVEKGAILDDDCKIHLEGPFQGYIADVRNNTVVSISSRKRGIGTNGRRVRKSNTLE